MTFPLKIATTCLLHGCQAETDSIYDSFKTSNDAACTTRRELGEAPQGKIYDTIYYIIFYYIILYSIILYYIILYPIVLYCIVLYYIVLYYIVLYCIILYCIVLYYIILYYKMIPRQDWGPDNLQISSLLAV